MPVEPTDELLRIAALYSPKIRDAMLQSYRYFLEVVPESKIIQIIDTDGFPGLLDLADTLGGAVAENVTPLLTDAWRSSGRKITSLLPSGALTGAFSFDTARVSALSASEAYRAVFVQGITLSQREAINNVIERSIMEGWTKPQLARGIRSSIGLTNTQEQWVVNYRNQLETLDPALFDRLLRDRRSDKLINRLIDNNGSLSEDQINSLVERYRQRLVKYRSETIARTESLRAVNMGEYESLLAAQDAGVLSPQLRRFWQTSQDERVRIYHMSIPNMNPEGRGMEEPFSTPLGQLMYPLDPNGVAANVINCRCRVVYRVLDAFGNYNQVASTGRMPLDVNEALGDLGELNY